MTLQILVPLHTCPDGSCANIAAHAAGFASYFSANVHGLVLYTTFSSATSIMGDMIINVDRRLRKVTAKCQVRGARRWCHPRAVIVGGRVLDRQDLDELEAQLLERGEGMLPQPIEDAIWCVKTSPRPERPSHGNQGSNAP